jgi:hypothetical protein
MWYCGRSCRQHSKVQNDYVQDRSRTGGLEEILRRGKLGVIRATV